MLIIQLGKLFCHVCLKVSESTQIAGQNDEDLAVSESVYLFVEQIPFCRMLENKPLP